MGLKCTICNHPARSDIDRMIVSGASNRSVVAQYPDISLGAVQRHKAHIPAHLAEAKHAEMVTQADNLIGDLQGLRTQALDFLNKAKEAEDLRAAAPLIGAAVKVIETLAEVRGELDRRATINIYQNPHFIQIQSIILSELESYPEIRERIVNRLDEVKE